MIAQLICNNNNINMTSKLSTTPFHTGSAGCSSPLFEQNNEFVEQNTLNATLFCNRTLNLTNLNFNRNLRWYQFYLVESKIKLLYPEAIQKTLTVP